MGKERELVKNTAIISFGKICTQLISFFLLPLYTALLSTEEYGTVDLVITYSSFLLPFITLALEQALFRFLIDERNNKDKACGYISTTFFLAGILLIIALVIIFFLYLVSRNSIFLYFALVLVGSCISTISLQVCRGLGDNIGYSFCSMLVVLGQIAFNVVFVYAFRWGAPGMMLATFLGNSIVVVVPLFRCNLLSYLKFSFCNRKTLRELLSYSLPLIPNQLSWWALNASDKIIVQFFIGVSANGLIAVANKFSSVYIQFSNIFNISWTESATLHFKDKDAADFYANTINTVYRLFLCACCGIIVCMPFVFPILVNEQYNEAFGLIPIFMLASLFNVIVSLYGVIYVAQKKSIEIAKTAVYAAILNAATHLILIRFIGIYAAAISTAIGYGGMAIYRYFHSRKYMVIKFSKVTIFFTVVMLLISFGTYYSGVSFLQTIAFFVVLVFSILLNKQIIISAFRLIKNLKKNS